MKNNLLRMVVVAAVTLLIFTSCDGSQDEIIMETASLNYIVFDDIDATTSWATDVVRARVLSSGSEWVDTSPRGDGDYRIFTTNEIVVMEVFKGELEIGDFVRIRQMGGNIGNDYFIVPRTELSIDGDMVLFLYDFGGNRPLGLLSPSQAAYHVPPDLTYPQTILDTTLSRSDLDFIVFESVNPNNHDIPAITLADIIHIYQQNIHPQPPAVTTHQNYLSTGFSNSFFVTPDGSLWGWGLNDRGQLGNGTMAPQTTPQVVFEDVSYIAAGLWHTMAIRNDGTLWACAY